MLHADRSERYKEAAYRLPWPLDRIVSVFIIGLNLEKTLVNNCRYEKFIMILSLSSLLILAACNAFVDAQDPGPSPTASVGCVAHGDHWYVRVTREWEKNRAS
jgi:hypothetical protein